MGRLHGQQATIAQGENESEVMVVPAHIAVSRFLRPPLPWQPFLSLLPSPWDDGSPPQLFQDGSRCKTLSSPRLGSRLACRAVFTGSGDEMWASPGATEVTHKALSPKWEKEELYSRWSVHF